MVPQAFHQNIEVPREPMKVQHIDFTEMNGKFVMTVVDRFSNKVLFIVLATTDANSIVKACSKIMTQWGLPRAFISDRDARFNDKLWRES